MNNNRQLSNPFSTGGGGVIFEARIQALFLTLMLTGGFVPGLPTWPIGKIKLQGKHAGYDTDDLVIFVSQPGGDQEYKMLAQIKHSIAITDKNEVFGEVIQAAWNDFNNSSLFTKEKDVIALITGPLNTTDSNDVHTILEWARQAEDAEEFFTNVERAKFSSDGKRAKLSTIRTQLDKANGGNPISEEVFYEFLRHFHLLGYDLDLKYGGTQSLLHSLIGQFSPDNSASLWARLVDEVQSANMNAGTISLDSLPDDLRKVFVSRVPSFIPNELLVKGQPRAKPEWNQIQQATTLAIANLLGSWSEYNDADQVIVQQLANEEYAQWVLKLREVLQHESSPVSLKDQTWHITERLELWQALGSRLFDQNLDDLQIAVVNVLRERDPQFELLTEERYLAHVRGKVLEHSDTLRKGMAETLALLGNMSDHLAHCSRNKAVDVARLAVREILANADWILWASLGGLISILAEAAPEEFLNAVEHALQEGPCPFDELFAQETNGILGMEYISGLLWALEALAWDEAYLMRVCVILGEIASHDPGGDHANRPLNSLTTILMPWLPQTTAPIVRRKATILPLCNEVPEVAWKLLLSLLPNQHQISFPTNRPSWRTTIPDDWRQGVSRQEYWEQVDFYAEQAVLMAIRDLNRLNEMIRHLENLPETSLNTVLNHLASDANVGLPEGERLPLWTSLMEVSGRHSSYPGADWVMSSETLSKIEEVAKLLAPNNPLDLHRRLFSSRDFELFEDKNNLEEQQEILDERRVQAIEEILNYGGLDAIIRFANSVESPQVVGRSLSKLATIDTDNSLLPSLLGDTGWHQQQFIEDYVRGRQQNEGWAWATELDKTHWSPKQIGKFLSYLPFTSETWERASAWLGDSEAKYWTKTYVNPYQAKGDLTLAIDKLTEHGRPRAALSCLYSMLHNHQPLDRPRSIEALKAVLSSTESPHQLDSHHIIEILKVLQDDPAIDPDQLLLVEWLYLPLLDKRHGGTPKILESRLAADPGFFLEMLKAHYRSKNEERQEQEPSDHDKFMARNAWELLNEWQFLPGLQPDGQFSTEQFSRWLEHTKEICSQSGYLEVALNHIGKVLIHSVADPNGLWIHHTIADALNSRNAEEMREGYRIAQLNSRGVHTVDPTGRPELELAQLYRDRADTVENEGYQRFAATLRSLAESYDRDADRIIARYGS